MVSFDWSAVNVDGSSLGQNDQGLGYLSQKGHVRMGELGTS